MRGYEEYRESRVKWLGEIPAHWGIVRIKGVFYCLSGNGFKLELQGASEGDYPFCKVSDLNSETRDMEKAKSYVDKLTVEREKFNIVPQYSILFPKIGEALKKNHRKINIVPCCIDNNCAALVTRNDGFSVQYGYYVSKCIDMACFNNGGTIPYVDIKQLMLYLIPVPPKDEQDQIARFLDWKISAIDRLILLRHRQLTDLEDLKKSAITRAVTRGLNPEVALRDSGVKWLGQIPSGWEVVRLKRVVNIIMGQSPEGESLNQFDGVEFHQSKIFFGDKIIKSSDIKTSAVTKIAPAYSVLLCVRAPVGKVNITDREICIGRGLAALDCLCGMSYAFLYYMLQHYEEAFKQESTGSTFEAITVAKVAKMLVPVPPLAEQQQISTYLDKLCSLINQATSNLSTQIDTLRELKTRLISDTVTGKIDVLHIPIPEQENP